MNSTNIQFTAEFMQTMSSESQTSPPCRSARNASNHEAQAQGGKAALQPASPEALPVEFPCTTVGLPLSMRFTRSSSMAITTVLPKAVEPGGYINV